MLPDKANMLDPAGTNAYTYWPGGSVHTDDGPFDNDTVSYTRTITRVCDKASRCGR